LFKTTRRALSLVLGAAMLQWGVATARSHCETAPAVQLEAHQHHSGAPVPADPVAPEDLPDCCIALGSCAMGAVLESVETKGVVIAVVGRIGQLTAAAPISPQTPPDPPPPRA
jgi:hypothetical protein